MTVEALAACGVRTRLFKHRLRDKYVLVGLRSRLCRYYGLDPEGIATVGCRLLDRSPEVALVTLWATEDRQRVYNQYGV